jgi:hypothetical protein
MYKRILVSAACMLSIMSSVAHAQSAEARAQMARIDSLLPALDSLRMEIARADSIRKGARLAREVEQFDTAIISPFTIITRKSQARETFAAYRAAVSSWDAKLQGLPADPRLVLVVDWQTEPYRRLQLVAREKNYRLISLYGETPMRRMRSVEVSVVDALFSLLPDSIRGWVKDQHLGRGLENEEVYRELATSSSSYAAGCVKRVVIECAKALGLAPVERTLGHSPTHIRRFVLGRRQHRGKRLRDCVTHGDTNACLDLAEATGGLPAPLSPTARASLLLFALERGGAGSLTRLAHPSRAAPAEAIASAANSSLSDLIADWRAKVERNRRITYAGLPRAVVAVLLWSAVALLFALRSTRSRVE